MEGSKRRAGLPVTADYQCAKSVTLFSGNLTFSAFCGRGMAFAISHLHFIETVFFWFFCTFLVLNKNFFDFWKRFVPLRVVLKATSGLQAPWGKERFPNGRIHAVFPASWQFSYSGYLYSAQRWINHQCFRFYRSTNYNMMQAEFKGVVTACLTLHGIS